MTGLERRAVTRVTSEYDYRNRKPFVIRLEVGGRLVKIRTKGSPRWYTVTIKQIHTLGAMNMVQEQRRIKAAKKAEKKALRESLRGR